MTWLRLEAAIFHDPKLRSLGGSATCVWIAVLTMAKMHGWRDGLVTKDEISAETVSDHMGLNRRDICGHDVTVTNVTWVGDAIKSLVAARFLEDAGTHWQIKNWRKFQSDPGASVRKQEQRLRDKGKGHSDKRDKLMSRGVTDVTPTYGTGRDVRDGRRTAFPSTSSGHSTEISPPRPADGSGRPGGLPAAASPGGHADGNGAGRILTPAENHEWLVALMPKLNGIGSPPSAAEDPERIESAARVRAELVKEIEECEAKERLTRLSNTKTKSEQGTPNSSPTSTEIGSNGASAR